ncbi:MAG: DUF4349 domain-containing protein [Erysipelotrichaceae bacterium]|nr:DUF4349 domain-containing protein [Erysipelotrichaceae bacterium]
MKAEKLIHAINDIDDKYIEEAHGEKKRFSLPKISFSWNTFGKLAAAACALLLVINLFPVLFHSYGRKGSSAGGSYMASDSAYPGSSYNGSYYAQEAMEAPAEAEYYVSDEEAKPSNGPSVDQGNARQGKKLILTSYMTMETQNMDELLEKISSLIAKYGGYVQRSSIYNQTSDRRTYDSSIRIPAANYEAFLAELKGEGNALSYSEEVKDITDSYADIEARLSSLRAQEAKVMEFYDKAEDLQDLITVESRLSEIRYQIEAYEAQIKNYDLLVSYSTLNLTVNETKVYTPVSPSFWQRLGSSFSEGFSDFCDGIGDFIVDFVYNIWTILFLILLGFAGYRIYKWFRNRKR